MPIQRHLLQSCTQSQTDSELLTETESELTETDVEGDSMLKTEGSFGEQASVKVGRKRVMSGWVPEEKNWEHCFQAIQYHIEIANLWYWSTEFATSPISDATELRKPDLVLLDYKLRKLDSSEKSWKDVLTGIKITQSDLSSDYKFGQEYALKDCWVNEDVKNVEIDFLKAVEGIQNVVQLVKYWDVLYDGQPNSTSLIHSHCQTFAFQKRIHCRILLTPCGLPLTQFSDIPELIGVFHDLLIGPKGAPAPLVDKQDLAYDPVQRWGDAFENATYDGLVFSSIWKQEFIHGLTQPPNITSYFTPLPPPH
ncbi:uncharacterized protein EDB93DRAFT_1110135 [Suillus bovinus]|uniref:uncharacterized protein n=1 Tax=Suillus bovinus TaxID=48563 RepID=UPI001B87FBC4|nr:uncharacterized protein EDB93DRAFT_1110135 [Suillus bovinus]KAG2125466.1 hypothetical protein EDB93DRAFT_1110135 [Suillus bovinus]